MVLSKAVKQQLRELIGQAATHQGVRYRVVELLEHELSLVLEMEGQRGELQENQYGDPGRRVAEVLTIPILSEDSAGFHPELLRLGVVSGE